MTVLLRFAPSPTGALHLGGLRTALYNYLLAKKHSGKLILRIEDTDATRAVPGAVDGIRSALEWAGIEYDYGPGRNGPHGPYFQSERLDLYHSHAKRLVESGRAYRCFCSPDKLAQTREKLARTGSNATYDKTCLNLTEEEVARRMRAGEKSVVRLNDSNLPARSAPADLVFGTLRDAHASLPTDPVLLKSDLFPTYHLASVVDDHEMGITHVLRGEEWLPSVPLHLDLYAALSFKPPQFAHVPLLLNPDGTKMSKRKGDVQVFDYKRRGWEPAAILNWLALAGWGVQSHANSSQESVPQPPSLKQAPDSTTPMSLPEMIEAFELTSITHRRTILDPMKLEYLNKQHLLRSISSDDGLSELAERVHPTIKQAFPSSQYTTVPYIRQTISSMKGRLTNLQDMPTLAPFFFVEPDLTSHEAVSMFQSVPQATHDIFLDSLLVRFSDAKIPWQVQYLNDLLHEEIAKLQMQSKAAMTVVRRAMTGMRTGPSVADIIHIIGKDRTVVRLETARAS
ncbi:glutamyl-tRNA synthetase [Cytidiella melzeri]|nr:glutamyl-tRNA synthetase [Cytidiella melzeri]